MENIDTNNNKPTQLTKCTEQNSINMFGKTNYIESNNTDSSNSNQDSNRFDSKKKISDMQSRKKQSECNAKVVDRDMQSRKKQSECNAVLLDNNPKKKNAKVVDRISYNNDNLIKNDILFNDKELSPIKEIFIKEIKNYKDNLKIYKIKSSDENQNINTQLEEQNALPKQNKQLN